MNPVPAGLSSPWAKNPPKGVSRPRCLGSLAGSDVPLFLVLLTISQPASQLLSRQFLDAESVASTWSQEKAGDPGPENTRYFRNVVNLSNKVLPLSMKANLDVTGVKISVMQLKK